MKQVQGIRQMSKGSWRGNLNVLEDLGVDGRTVLKCILRAVGWKGVNWIHMPVDRDSGGPL